METILGYLGIVVAVIAVLSVLPITKEIVRPLLSAIGEFIVWIGKEFGAWFVYPIKTIIKAHTTMFDHMINKKENFDRVEMLKRIKNKNK